jgi:hypothetical protein
VFLISSDRGYDRISSFVIQQKIKMSWARDLLWFHQRVLRSGGLHTLERAGSSSGSLSSPPAGPAQLRITGHAVRLTGGSHLGPFGPKNRGPDRDLEVVLATRLPSPRSRRLTDGPDSSSWHHRSFGINRSAEMGAAGQHGGEPARAVPVPQARGEVISLARRVRKGARPAVPQAP